MVEGLPALLPLHHRAIITRGSLEQAIEIAVTQDGQPRWVQFQRWSNANPEKAWRLQPFGGYLDDFQNFEGFTLPTKVEAGNHFGIEAYCPFIRVRVRRCAFRP
ncbi:DUF6544 family protein [Billgrantia zhangzhouensis]|uniref:DUF6544 family protein n=1 Tax=Billgrantia zhangzhouensis TaxID=2733481 RepID=UPI001F32029D|nr:DUF6544 family protein [Halomonas zhangzhouensis]